MTHQVWPPFLHYLEQTKDGKPHHRQDKALHVCPVQYILIHDIEEEQALEVTFTLIGGPASSSLLCSTLQVVFLSSSPYLCHCVFIKISTQSTQNCDFSHSPSFSVWYST
eukprot:TRINITY_DN2468_c0_g1_i2.p1 TRINITY_DN2468_c0_g1~~TRINITY_DN2468_c0_g1_i2.p1  ORF type:complete len:110 (+),score=14.31 TRINITY_DN2468_c0_g1_i2:374-703(+)